MADQKPRYRLEKRSKNYVGLCEGERQTKHSLCAICINTKRGLLDAQLLLLVMNSHKDLLAACSDVLGRFRTEAFMECTTAEYCEERLTAAIKNAKPKPKQESTL